MIKVRILQRLTTVGAAALTLPSLVACTTSSTDDVGSESSNNTESVAGSGVLSVHGWRIYYGSTSGGDEFVRVGERLEGLDGLPDDGEHGRGERPGAAPGAASRPQQAEGRGPCTIHKGRRLDVRRAAGCGFMGSRRIGAHRGHERRVRDSERRPRVKIELVATYARGGVPQTMESWRATRSRASSSSSARSLPNKLALFDTVGARPAHAHVEGGRSSCGSHAARSRSPIGASTRVVDKYDARSPRRRRKRAAAASAESIVAALRRSRIRGRGGRLDRRRRDLPARRRSTRSTPPSLRRADGFRYASSYERQVPSDAAARTSRSRSTFRAFLQGSAVRAGIIELRATLLVHAFS